MRFSKGSLEALILREVKQALADKVKLEGEVDCGSCSGYHLPSFRGDCRDDGARFSCPNDLLERRLVLLANVVAARETGTVYGPVDPPMSRVSLERSGMLPK
jgi:hypothetical protein